jgi:glutamate--cysteine ligase
MIASGVTLVARGVDPYNDIGTVPLQLRRDRYVRMTEYFDSIGPSGVRMMRQTAALQINVERGEDPLSRWLLLNALTPVVVALFASSGRYAGTETGFASFRSQLWRTLDPSRTGIAYGGSDPARHYLDFALDAVAMRSGGEGSSYQSFRDWMLTGETTVEDWHFHLSTLFPEVRPKEYFELRSADTIEIEWLAAPIVFVTGIVYDPAAAGVAMSLLGAPSRELLERAGRLGLRDPELRSLAGRLSHLAVQGAETAGADYVKNDHVQTARAYFARALDAS